MLEYFLTHKNVHNRSLLPSLPSEMFYFAMYAKDQNCQKQKFQEICTENVESLKAFSRTLNTRRYEKSFDCHLA